MRKYLLLVSLAVGLLGINSSASEIKINLSDANTGSSGIKFNGQFEHANAYYWRVNIDQYLKSAIAAGDTFVGAKLTIEGINNSQEIEAGDSFYVSLLDVKKPYLTSTTNQLKIYTDNTQKDYFANLNRSTSDPFKNYTAYTHIGTYSDTNAYKKKTGTNRFGQPTYSVINPSDTVSWDIDVSLINKYKDDYDGFASSGFIGIGLDADCHYSGNVFLTLLTTPKPVNPPPTNVPEPGSIPLILLGLSSIAGAFVARKRN